MGIVYVLTNPMMKGLVKIGYTTRTIEERLRTFNTAVPEPYVCVSAWEIDNAAEVEKTLHRAFDDRRYNKFREFFRIDAKAPAAILEHFGDRPVTPDTGEIAEAPKNAKPRRGHFRFSTLGIKKGCVLVSIWDDSVTCKVVGDRRVEFEGKEMTLSAAAKKVAGSIGKNWRTINGTLYWTRGKQGPTIAAIRAEKGV